MTTGALILALAAALAAGAAAAESSVGGPGLLKSEFIFETGPFASCHASTLAESKGGLVTAWFGGTREGRPDVGIWFARCEGGRWTAPVEVAIGAESDKRYPAWNPVLFQPKSGPLLLFYKVGPSPAAWWGMLLTSDDGGKSWSAPRRLPEGILGPIKNKPVEMPGGDVLCPTSTENAGWRVHFERTSDQGRTWQATGPLNDGKEFGAIQPSLLSLGKDRLLAVGRTTGGRVFEVRSEDAGRTWGPMTLGALPNPNSGIDAVTLADGRHLLVYNHSAKSRTPLNVAVSADGRAWQAALVLENESGEFSYPAAIQAADGLVHVTYTWKRLRIRHVVVDPSRLQLRPIVGGEWPSAGAP